MSRIFDDNFLEMLDDLCTVVIKKHTPATQNKPAKKQELCLYTYDHGKIVRRNVEYMTLDTNPVDYRKIPGDVDENKFYGSYHRFGNLVTVKFVGTQKEVTMLKPANCGMRLFSRSQCWWYNKEDLIRHLEHRYDTAVYNFQKYAKLARYHENIVSQLDKTVNG